MHRHSPDMWRQKVEGRILRSCGYIFSAKPGNIEVMTVRQGDRVRIRFGNLTMSSHPIHIHGHTWRVVGTEGGPVPDSAQWPGNTINVPRFGRSLPDRRAKACSMMAKSLSIL